MKWRIRLVSIAAIVTLPLTAAAQDSPNMLVIMGDDIGSWNGSTYNQGIMGYETPNIDRIASEGMFFTDAHGEQSCTAGLAIRKEPSPRPRPAIAE